MLLYCTETDMLKINISKMKNRNLGNAIIICVFVTNIFLLRQRSISSLKILNGPRREKTCLPRFANNKGVESLRICEV